MACPGVQELPPSECRKNVIVPKTLKSAISWRSYKKLGSSFPTSASAQDLNDFVEAASTEGINEEGPKTEWGPANAKTESSFKKQNDGWKWFSQLWRKGFKKRFPSIPPKTSIKFRSRSAREKTEIDQKCLCNPTWKLFTLAEVQDATNNFSSENIIGKGGSAEVYKGRLSDGQRVAIKRLNKGVPEEEVLSFLSEIGIIAHTDHPNIAKMIGYGVDGGTHLVLQFSSLGSLRSRLHCSEEKLDWATRYKIILGVAEGLSYLHENCQRRIIHRDIKVDNILLSEDFQPQICDFGLAKWLPRQWSHRSATKFEGTFGYLAPEYFMRGVIDEKTDVFAFGVLLLEIITGRRAVDELRKSLVVWAKPLLESDAAVQKLVDPALQDYYDPVEMGWIISTAKMCIDETPILRPPMRQVVRLLRGNDKKAKLLGRHHQKQFNRRTYSDELSYAEEYNATKHLIDSI